MPRHPREIDFPQRGRTIPFVLLSNYPELERLPRNSRLQIAEELWDSAASDALPVPASHKALIRSRREAYARGELKTVSLAELKKSIRRRA